MSLCPVFEAAAPRTTNHLVRVHAAMMRDAMDTFSVRVFAGIVALSCAVLVACSSSGASSNGPPSTTARGAGGAMGVDAGTSSPTGKTYAVPRSIASDCSTDVTAPLAKWVASVPDNSTLTLGKGACYQVEGSLVISSRRSLLLDGNGSTLQAKTTGTRTRIHFGIDNSENIIVRDLTVKGANAHAGATPSAYNAKLEAQHAFNLGGVRHVLLENVRASDVYGDFVYISSSRRGQPSEHVAIVHSQFSRNGRQGIAVTSARDVTIRGNDIAEVARSMFDLEPNSTRDVVRDVHIEQNTTGAALNFWIASKGAGNQIGGVDVRDNTMRSATGGLVFVFGGTGGARGPFTFAGNDLRVTGAVTDEGAVGAFFFAHTDTVDIRNNQIALPRGRGMPAVELRSCNHVVVDGNRVKNGSRLVMADQASNDVHASG
jgi:Right handed beta helix region